LFDKGNGRIPVLGQLIILNCLQEIAIHRAQRIKCVKGILENCLYPFRKPDLFFPLLCFGRYTG
jgi:hypothetical protein